MIPLLLALACVPVDGPKLLARHIATMMAEFAQVPPDTELGYAPLPGVVRTMRGDELQRVASKHGITIADPGSSLCFAWPMQPIEPTEAASAMRKALPPNTRIEVLELSRIPAPAGALEFPLEALQGSVWRGVVHYSATGRFDVWARVRITAKQTRVVTLAPLRSGEMITAGQLKEEEFEDAPVVGLVASIDDAVGKISKRTLPAGSHLKTQFLDHPAAVAKGDTVRLRATVGVAHVVTEAAAQAAGRIGDIIPVKNPSSGRILRARIEAPGEVRLTQ
jgi:flagella basal body P-ring formation protein FlgA